MTRQKKLEAATGFEPVSDGFANRCLGPLGYAASAGAVYHCIAQAARSQGAEHGVADDDLGLEYSNHVR